MNADHFFAIGSSHKVCQDYAASHTSKDRTIAIVSDGCSSSPHTDFGSRILSRCALQEIVNCPEQSGEGLFESIWNQARAIADHSWLNLPKECLDASLLIATAVAGHTMVYVSGDGVITAKHIDGTTRVIKIEYVGGAPVYMSYWYNKARRQKLNELYDCTRIVTETILGKEEIVSETRTLADIEIADLYAYLFGPEYVSVSIMSDGALSFQCPNPSTTTKSKDKVSLHAVLEEVARYKNCNGQFVARRCAKYLSEARAKGVEHYDDFSIATISREGRAIDG